MATSESGAWRPLNPTGGDTVVKSGTAVFDEMRAGIRRIEDLADPNQGELRFGCPEVMAGGLMQEIIKRFLKAHPRVTLDVVTLDTVAGNFRELREREIEFLIGRIRMPFADDELTSEVLAHEGLVIVAGKTNPLHRKKRIKLADLVDQPWMLPPESSLPGAMARNFFAVTAWSHRARASSPCRSNLTWPLSALVRISACCPVRCCSTARRVTS